MNFRNGRWLRPHPAGWGEPGILTGKRQPCNRGGAGRTGLLRQAPPTWPAHELPVRGNMGGSIFIGCAGWALRRDQAQGFPGAGTHLTRYARGLPCMEINSTFYKPYRRTTYARWAESTPAAFQFAVKLPKAITHEQRLVNANGELAAFIREVGALGKGGAPLVQLPPSLELE